ncbi:MAG: fused MFS/spermidine synthase [Verrucomicrobiota bacterium]|nr:fused MFS/spermidine synthase [Verrucomicrobiota bacterium]
MRVAIVSFILFLSGCSALIFQTLWLRLSGLAFGNSVWSAALILSSFMAGLGLGSAIAASSQLRRVRPLHLYAALELVVALFGCTIVFGLPSLGEWLRPVFQLLWQHHALLNALRFVISFLVLLVPTTAMGLTLPVLIEDPFLKRHDFGRALGLLYGANTLGAVAGALLGEGLLIGAFGLWGTSAVAGLINCAAAAAAWSVARASSLPAANRGPSLVRRVAYQKPWRLLAISAGSGAILLSLEVVWFRFLRLYVASSATAFSIMLAVVLAGIGLGGLTAGAVHRRAGRSDQWLPILLLLAAITTLVCYIYFPIPKLRPGEESFFFESWREVAALSLPLMFPGAFLSGMLFPAVVAHVNARIGNRMNSTGLATLANTAGAAAGPLLATFLLLPMLGFQTTLIICATGYVLLAVFAWPRGSLKSWSTLGSIALAIIFAVTLLLFPFGRDEAHFANARRGYESAGLHLVKKIEGTSDTYQLLRRDFLAHPYYYRLLTDAFTMSATNPRSQRYMRLFAYLPQVLRPHARDALLICFGLGQTADALTKDAELQRIDIVDISKEVFRLADSYFGDAASNPLRDPRVRAFVQDGRFFLQATPQRYDIITGEPPPPKVAGAVNLYTEQFFRLMKSRLKENGVATFWLPIYQLKVSETKAILRAFQNAFPNASVWASGDEEWIMTGINGPGERVYEQDLQKIWADPGRRTDLARIGVETPEQIGALFLMDGDEIERITRGVPPLTDIHPKRLSDEPGDLEETHRFATGYLEAAAATRRFGASELIERLWPESMRSGIESAFVVRETRFFSDIHGSNALAELDLYLRHSRLRSPVLEVLHTDEFRLAIAEQAAATSAVLPADALPDLIAGALARRDFGGAIQLLEREATRRVPEPNDLFLLTYLYCLNGNVEKAEQLAAANAGTTQRDWFVDWLWGKLQAEFGFRPPA